MQKNETGPPPYATYKNKFKMIKDLNIKPETIKLIEESIGSKFADITRRNIFTDTSPRSTEVKEKMNIGTTSNLKVLYNVFIMDNFIEQGLDSVLVWGKECLCFFLETQDKGKKDILTTEHSPMYKY